MTTLINIVATSIIYYGQSVVVQAGDTVADTTVQAAVEANGGLFCQTTDAVVSAAIPIVQKLRTKGANEATLNQIMLSAFMASAYTTANSDPGSCAGTLPITVSTIGNAATVGINAATDALPGSMSAADKTKLDSMSASAAVSAVSGTLPITVATGTSTPVIAITAATDALPGSMSAADKTKLDNIGTATGAVVQHLHIDVPQATIAAKSSGAAFAIGAALPANARVVACDLTVTTALTGVTTATATVQGGTDTAGSLVASANVFTGTVGNVYGGTGSNPYASRGSQQLYMTITGGAALSGVLAGDLDVDVFYTVQA